MEMTKVIKELTKEEQMSISGGEVKYIMLFDHGPNGEVIMVVKPIQV